MPKMSRTKGKLGEAQVVALARDAGFPDANRSWQTPQLDGDLQGIPGVHLEVRRREGTSVEAWAKEVEQKCRNGNLPVVAWRRSNQPWRATLPLTDLLELLAQRNGGTLNPATPERKQ